MRNALLYRRPNYFFVFCSANSPPWERHADIRTQYPFFVADMTHRSRTKILGLLKSLKIRALLQRSGEIELNIICNYGP